MASLLPKDVAGLTGAAWVATLALASSGYYANRAHPGGLDLLIDRLPAYLPFLLVLIGVGLTYSRRSMVGWVVLLLLSAIGTLTMFATSSWGSSMTHGPELAKLRYYSHTFTGDALLAFGSVVLLGVSIAAIFVELIARSEA